MIWKQQNLHIKENDQHVVQLLPNKLVTPFITVLLVSINVFDLTNTGLSSILTPSLQPDFWRCQFCSLSLFDAQNHQTAASKALLP